MSDFLDVSIQMDIAKHYVGKQINTLKQARIMWKISTTPDSLQRKNINS